MHKIHHRINTFKALSSINSNNGAEIDLRYHNNEIILHHDPFRHQEQECVTLKDFLGQFHNNGILILNLKTEGIEQQCIDLMNQYGIENWFFLDMSPPTFVKYSQMAFEGKIKGFSPENLAVRYSEQEPLEYALNFQGKAKWIWVDCFTHLPLNKSNYSLIKSLFKICLVSPELQAHSLDEIKKFKEQLLDKDIDAVCSKRLDLW